MRIDGCFSNRLRRCLQGTGGVVLVAILAVGVGGACKKRRAPPGNKARITSFLKCVKVVESAGQPGERAPLIARCVSSSKLFGRTKCNDAWEGSLAAAPDERWRMIAVGCGRLYCPILKAPKPGLCGRLGSLGPASPRPQQWHAFFRAVVLSEAGSSVSEAKLKKVLRALAGSLVVRVR